MSRHLYLAANYHFQIPTQASALKYVVFVSSSTS